jgi:hypothetical protein
MGVGVCVWLGVVGVPESKGLGDRDDVLTGGLVRLHRIAGFGGGTITKNAHIEKSKHLGFSEFSDNAALK